ncbi:MAG TPA: Maf family protein [Stellaceae bacterium]|jgi:septum formation protein
MSKALVLASASTARARLLRDAGIVFEVEPADLDEAAVKRAQRRAGAGAPDCAMALAVLKAQAIPRRHPSALVVGSDQMLDLDGEWFDKPADREAAWRQLAALRGRTHRLPTAVCVCRDEAVLWQAVSEPRLTMRDFSDTFLDAYLAEEGEVVLSLVGAYRLEGRGAQLFAAIEGDLFAIQGLPLIELLGFLRSVGVIPT